MLKIREMQKSDISSIIKIYREIDKSDSNIIKKIYTKFYSKPKLKRNKNVRDYVIIKEKKIIGFSGFNKEETETKDIYWLNWTAIDVKENQKGHGSELIKYLVKELKKKKGRKLYVSTSSKNKRGISFYKKIGFKKEAVLKDYYSIKDNSIIFSINI